jgi:hypothetical protein
MRPLSAAELLAVWEWGAVRSPLERGMVLLAAACPEDSPEDLLHLTIGGRDARLLELRELTFGPQLESQIACPACDERLELNIAVADLLASAPPAAPPAETGYRLEHDGWRVRFRLLDSLDLFGTAEAGADLTSVRLALLRRCVLAVAAPQEGESGGLPEKGLPAELEAALLARIELLDAAGSLSFALACPACSHNWIAPFDILSFFWAEIEAWVHRTLREVHLLAEAYGWRESDILALTPWRRQAYLELTGNA